MALPYLSRLITFAGTKVQASPHQTELDRLYANDAYLDARLTAAVTPAGPGEVTDAHADAFSNTYTTLKERLDSEANKASKSNATDTGSATCTHLRALTAASTSQASGANSACIATSSTSVASGSRSAVIASQASTASGTKSAVIASNAGTASGTNNSLVAASDTCTAGGAGYTAAIASATMTVSPASGIAFSGACYNGTVSGYMSAAISSQAPSVTGQYSTVIGSNAGTASTDNAIVIGCVTATASGSRSLVSSTYKGFSGAADAAIIACSGGKTTSPATEVAIIASTGTSDGTVGGTTTNVISNGGSAVIMASGEGLSSGTRVASIAGYGCDNQGTATVILASQYVQATAATATNAVCGGYAGSGPATTANRTWQLAGNGGIGYFEGGTNTAAGSLADYAEYFESLDGAAIPTGTIVALEGDRIRPARAGDDMLGIVSETAGVVMGEATFAWQGRYLRNEFGGWLWQTIHDPAWRPAVQPESERPLIPDPEWVVPEGVEEDARPLIGDPAWIPQPIQTEADRPLIRVRVENPEWSVEQHEAGYLSRAERPEWNVIGLLGQVHIRIDETVVPGCYVEADDSGRATKAKGRGQGWRVMKVKAPYDPAKGYGVALVFVR